MALSNKFPSAVLPLDYCGDIGLMLWYSNLLKVLMSLENYLKHIGAYHQLIKSSLSSNRSNYYYYAVCTLSVGYLLLALDKCRRVDHC